MLEIRNLSKSYGEQHALQKVSFRAGNGVTGFLGPNGAGKTTTMRIITGSLLADSGEVLLDGEMLTSEDLGQKSKIGYLPESNALYKNMRVDEFLLFIAELKQVTKTAVAKVAHECGLDQVLSLEIESLSKGYRQRVGLAKALLGDPKYLILDEPTTGLDPNQKQEILQLIKKLSRSKVVLFSSHVLSEVKAIATSLVIINEGEIVAQGKLESLLQDYQQSKLSLTTLAPVAEFVGAVEKIKEVVKVTPQPKAKLPKGYNEFEIQVSNSLAASEAIFWQCAKKKWPIIAMHKSQEDLDELFRQLTK